MPGLIEKLKNRRAPVDEFAGLNPEETQKLVRKKMSEADSGQVEDNYRGWSGVANSALDGLTLASGATLLKGLKSPLIAAPTITRMENRTAQPSPVTNSYSERIKPANEQVRQMRINDAMKEAWAKHREAIANQLGIDVKNPQSAHELRYLQEVARKTFDAKRVEQGIDAKFLRP